MFLKETFRQKSKNSKAIKYSSLSSADRAKCNDLVQKALRFAVYLDPWIKRNKKGRLGRAFLPCTTCINRYFSQTSEARNSFKKIFRFGVFFRQDKARQGSIKVLYKLRFFGVKKKISQTYVCI